MMDAQLMKALAVSGGLILLLILVALADARPDMAADAGPPAAPATVTPT